MIPHHVTKQANHTTLHGGASGGTRTLATYLAEDLDIEEEEELLADFKTYLVDKRSKGGGKFQSKPGTKKTGERKRWKRREMSPDLKTESGAHL